MWKDGQLCTCCIFSLLYNFNLIFSSPASSTSPHISNVSVIAPASSFSLTVNGE